MPNQYAEAVSGPQVPSNTGLTPDQELAQWKQWRDQVDASGGVGSLSPDAQRYYNGPNPRPGDARFTGPDGSYSAAFSPEAGEMFVNAKTHYDPKTGEVAKNKGYFNQKESWIQLALGGAFAGAAAAGALPGAFGGAAGSGTQAATTALPAAGTAAGGGTAATVAGTAAPVAAKGVKSWLTGNAGSLIDKGVQAGTGIWAANKAAGAAEDAAKLQEKYYDEALKAEREEKDYDRNQYADYLQRLDPYTQTGYGANDRIAQFGGQAVPNRPPPLARPPMTSLPQQQAPMVKLKAPDGSVQDVPAEHVDHYVKLGATPLQQ
jgi:hypothetical protein